MDHFEKCRRIAARFAAALDACDYAVAEQYLAAGCEYRGPQAELFVGPAAILDSYSQSDAKARSNFDRVEYRSEAAVHEPAGILLTFFDELHLAESVHTYRCGQIVYFCEQLLIDRIELLEFPGERERLRQFCTVRGVTLE